MAVEGIFGAVVFGRARGRIHTFHEVQRNYKGRFGTHMVHMRKPLLEWAGNDLLEIHMAVNLDASWCGNPLSILAEWHLFHENALAAPLIIGGKPMGPGLSLFVITELSETHKHWLAGGRLIAVELSVTFQEYIPFTEGLLSALGVPALRRTSLALARSDYGDDDSNGSTKFSGYGQTSDLGANWRIKFYDADGIPLNMLSFDVIDFGAISYKEIFQNVKTILATPVFSAALERLLGVDQTIVDLPIDQAAQATVAILDALYFWESRVEVVNINFESDVTSAHLICNLELKIKNVIYGTDQQYDRNNISALPLGTYSPALKTWEQVTPRETVIIQTVPMVGATGPAGERGSFWFTGTGAPTAIAGAKSQDLYLDGATGDVYQYDGASWRKRV